MNGEDKHHKSQNKIDVMQDIDSVPSNIQSVRQEALLYIFEDNEAVIKMIIKGKKSYSETCLQNPQSPQNPNQIHRHQKPTRRHLDQREFHT